ncbi:hypothetical protein NMY22_g17319 [Coprinellus aureogranulatus]|nr:hypothetical protein NMY22_g17319 [Coprinellus aureogranulatus]
MSSDGYQSIAHPTHTNTAINGTTTTYVSNLDNAHRMDRDDRDEDGDVNMTSSVPTMAPPTTTAHSNSNAGAPGTVLNQVKPQSPITAVNGGGAGLGHHTGTFMVTMPPPAHTQQQHNPTPPPPPPTTNGSHSRTQSQGLRRSLRMDMLLVIVTANPNNTTVSISK